MIAKYIFEPSDFIGMGQMVVRQSAQKESEDISFMASVSYKIGWMSREVELGNDVVMISLEDGMCVVFPTIQSLCDNLNLDGEGFRPMTKDEIERVMLCVGNRFIGRA